MQAERIERVLRAMKEEGISQMLVIDPMSIYYMTDVYVQPMERFLALLLRTKEEPVLFLNSLFTIPENVPIRQIWMSDTDDAVAQIMEYIDPQETLGVDKDLKARILLPLMERKAANGFVNASMLIDLTRGVKSSQEIEKMRTASKINDLAMNEFKKLIREGVTEEEVAGQMLAIYQKFGAQGYSFEPIVSFGANAADPHHEPDGTVLKEGDCIIFDVGCIKDGYCSDMTRTFFYKSVSEQAREVYDTVRRANEAAEAKICEGVPICELDHTARGIITEKGYGSYFTHRLGHFIGLSVHEYGDISAANFWEAKAGMIFSIEPGIYLPGKVGVRIEDLVLVTEDGVERLNHYSKELEILG